MSRQAQPRSPAAISLRERRRSLVAGLIGIVAMALISFAAFTKDNPFTHGYRVAAVFTSSNQIRNASPVRIAGVTVGEVTGTSDGPGETQVVEMELTEHGLPIHQDATARIRPRVFLEGGYYVDLRPGSPSAPELTDGGRLPLSQTAIPVQLDQVLSAFDRPARESLLALLDRFAYVLEDDNGSSLSQVSTELEPLLRNGAWLAEALRGSEPGDVHRLLSGAARTATVLGQRQARLSSLMANLNRTAAVFASHDDELSLTLREAAELIELSPSALDALDRAAPALERFLASLRPALPALPQVLSDSADLLGEARGIVSPQELPRLIDAVRPLLEALPQEVPGLTSLFGQVETLSECVGERIVPLLLSEVPDKELSTGQPVWQELAHALVGVSSNGAVFDANGPILRLNGLVGERTISIGNGVGGGPLIANPPEELLGTRPRWLGPGVGLPYEPDAVCTEQAPPDLSARTDGAITSAADLGPSASVSREVPTLAQLEELGKGLVPEEGG